MANVLGNYDQQWFANEALIQLEKQLGMAGTIHRGYDQNPQIKGSVIQIRRPATFTAQDAPSSAQDAVTETVSITLNKHREVKVKWTDKDMSLSAPQVITDHLRPMMVALGDDLDQNLNALRTSIPWFYDVGASPSPADITGVRKVMRDNKVPLRDQADLFLQIDSTLEDKFLQLAAFSQQQGAGDQGVAAQASGMIGPKYGFNVFANQNVATHTGGTVVSTGTDVAGAVNGAHLKSATSLVIQSLNTTQTIKKGDTFAITGQTQRYAAAADLTLSSGAGTLTIVPALVADVADTTVVTFENGSGSSIHAASYSANLAYHRHAFALATAPLSDAGNGRGAEIAIAADPITGIALRSRSFYVGNDSALYLSFDVLYGLVCLNPNLAVVMRRDV